MSYSYEVQKKEIFTEEGQRIFLAVRDASKRLLKKAGAFRQLELMDETQGDIGDSWTFIACVDRLVELGEIVELKRDCWTQYKVYTDKLVHNY